MLALMLVFALASGVSGGVAGNLTFHQPLFAAGMILQRGLGTRVWGSGAQPSATVTVRVLPAGARPVAPLTAISATATADAAGDWQVSLPVVDAQRSATLEATDGATTTSVSDVNFGEVILCGGQSNMGFGMCGATSKTQSPQEALDKVGASKVRYWFQAGSGPNGGAGASHCKTSAGTASVTPATTWFTANASNAGGASAVCLLTAQYLAEAMPGVPVGAVESCIGGTNVEPWTPPAGSLYVQHIVPLLPMTYRFALWDQGEADAKRTNSSWYATEFPTMIKGWRDHFEAPSSGFFYVELCTEYGAQEPKEKDFWLAQRSALALPLTGFATTTDIQRALHPPDKQDVAARLLLEVQRVVYGKGVVSRGPELLRSSSPAPGRLALVFSNASMSVQAGIFVGDNATCAASNNNTMATQRNADGQASSVPYTINGATVTVTCNPKLGNVYINADDAGCFLYGPTRLPAPPIEVPCN